MDKKVVDIAEDIKSMKIRGAAKIGRTVAEALKIEAENCWLNKFIIFTLRNIKIVYKE